jgi:hypothetical protein
MEILDPKITRDKFGNPVSLIPRPAPTSEQTFIGGSRYASFIVESDTNAFTIPATSTQPTKTVPFKKGATFTGFISTNTDGISEPPYWVTTDSPYGAVRFPFGNARTQAIREVSEQSISPADLKQSESKSTRNKIILIAVITAVLGTALVIYLKRKK